MSSFADADPPVALGALDGRYRPVVAPLVDFLSEAALNRMRVRVEVEWLDPPDRPQGRARASRHLTDDEKAALRRVVSEFGPAQVDELAAIERETVHDVKAVEYFLKRRLATIVPADEDRGLGELVHFACTSEDVNNLSYALMVQGAVRRSGCPARRPSSTRSPTWPVSCAAYRCWRIRTGSRPRRPRSARSWPSSRRGCGGSCAGSATPSTSASSTAPPARTGRTSPPCPTRTGRASAGRSSRGSGSRWNPLTTQIESHDWQAELYADLARFNRVMHNLCTDVWTYISFGYFAQVRGQGTVGSSTMPHKVNPIRFENAEANLEVSNALFDVLAATLVQSRLQRDLTDSSMQRNIGSAFGHSVLALDNVARGLAGLDAVPATMAADLDANWEVLGRGGPVGDARPRGAGRTGDGRAVRAAQGADPWAADRRRGHARRSSPGSGCRRTSRRGCRR